MVTPCSSPAFSHQRGASLIEVLVAMVVVAFGLLGIVGMQARLQVSEMETYQRSQALLLLNDMANRMAINRNAAASYVTTASSPLGTGMSCPTATATVVQQDLREWCNAMQGAGETTGTGADVAKVGVMVGGRGCVEVSGSEYLVTVVWQGLVPVSAPPASVACGVGSYNGPTGSSCVNDLCRRNVTTLVRIANLS